VSKMPGRDELICFVDYDGVLHNEAVWWSPEKGPHLRAPAGHSLFQHAPLLQEVLLPHPQVKIVLSTSWVRSFGFAAALDRLPPPLRAKTIADIYTDMTDDCFGAPRGVQIWSDVLRRQPRNWLAIDDDAEGWPESSLDKLVRCDGVHGISAPAALSELRQKLEHMCRAA
jgi:hypothetical protein